MALDFESSKSDGGDRRVNKYVTVINRQWCGKQTQLRLEEAWQRCQHLIWVLKKEKKCYHPQESPGPLQWLSTWWPCFYHCPLMMCPSHSIQRGFFGEGEMRYSLASHPSIASHCNQENPSSLSGPYKLSIIWLLACLSVSFPLFATSHLHWPSCPMNTTFIPSREPLHELLTTWNVCRREGKRGHSIYKQLCLWTIKPLKPNHDRQKPNH